MKKKWLIALLVVTVLAALFIIEISKVKTGINNRLPSLDNLESDAISKAWAPFYRVRATIIDGQSANFSIPGELRAIEGKIITLTGAAVFYGNGCEMIDNNTIRVSYFILVPSLGIADACEIRSDISMRWTILVNLREPWILTRSEMSETVATVSGIFKIDTSKPYDAAFFIENASAELNTEND